MRVFNLTPATEIEYRGRMIPPNGGYVDIQGVSFIPDRDRNLERDGLIAFDVLPIWFINQQETAEAARTQTTPVVVPDQKITTVDPVVLEPTVLEPSTPGAESASKKTRK